MPHDFEQGDQVLHSDQNEVTKLIKFIASFDNIKNYNYINLSNMDSFDKFLFQFEVYNFLNHNF